MIAPTMTAVASASSTTAVARRPPTDAACSNPIVARTKTLSRRVARPRIRGHDDNSYKRRSRGVPDGGHVRLADHLPTCRHRDKNEAEGKRRRGGRLASEV